MADVTKEIGITRMDCPTCVVTLEKSVMKVPGVRKAQGNYLKKTLKVTYDEATPLVAIEKAIEDVGYQVAYKKYPSPLSKLKGLFSRGESKAITSITDAEFREKVLGSAKPVAVLFSSEGCPSLPGHQAPVQGPRREAGGQRRFLRDGRSLDGDVEGVRSHGHTHRGRLPGR